MDYANYMFVDTLVTISIIAWIFYFKVYSSVLDEKINSGKVAANIYAVEVKGLPATREEGAPNEIEIQNQFQ